MRPRTHGDDPSDVFAEVLYLLERNLRYLESVGLSPSTAKAYRRTITFLKRRTDSEIASIVRGPKRGASMAASRTGPDMSDEEIVALSGAQIEVLLSSGRVSRRFLERLASLRFGVSVGGLSTLRNRDALVDKLRTLLRNESTHDAISRTVRGRQ